MRAKVGHVPMVLALAGLAIGSSFHGSRPSVEAATAGLDGANPPVARSAAADQVKALKVTVLSTMLADRYGVGEWGFAALVEADGRRLLVDTGARPDTVLHNAADLGVDLSAVTDVLLTHNHDDHTGGLLTLRNALLKKNRRALSRAHVGKGIFLPRLDDQGRDGNGLLPKKTAYEKSGGIFIEHDHPEPLFPGVWLTGPVPRPNAERNWSGDRRIETPGGPIEDTIPEDTALVIETPEGLVVVSGCGHAGIVNTCEYARKVTGQGRVLAAIGGFHLFPATDEQLDWTARRLRDFDLGYLLGAHCTGVEAVFRIRKLARLSRETAVVGAVGSSFTLGKGIDPLSVAR